MYGYVRYVPSPDEEKFFEQLFKDQQEGQIGFGYGFVGAPYQRGAGLGAIFSSLFRAISPLAKSAAKAVGRKALDAGLAVGSDILAGKNVKESFKTHAKAAGKQLLNDTANVIKKRTMKGDGFARPPKRPKKTVTVFDLKKKK